MNTADLLNFGLYLASFKLNQWKSPEEIKKIQEKKLRRIISVAKNSVPYYRKSLSGMESLSLDSISRLPVLEKAAIAQNPESFINETARNLIERPTSGSAGMPLKIVIGADGLYGLALRYHCMTEAGFGPLDVLINTLSFPLYQSFPQRFVYRIMNLSPFEDERNMLKSIRSVRSGIFFGYPSTLTLLSALNSGSPGQVSLKCIITTSETLTPRLRTGAEKSFACRVRDYYGSNECGVMAFECEKGSLHAISDSAIIEIVDDEGQPAESGSVLVTSLWRTSMPFIRYRLGDSAVFRGKCRCGRASPAISVEGRESRFVILPSGMKFIWAKIQMRLKSVEGVLGFQCIQEDNETLSFRLVPSGRPSPDIAEKVRATALSALPEPMDVKVGWAEKIGREKSGKVTDFIPLRGA
ncbi:MAG TPA: hypothetical protein VLD37_02390 [Candidatus Bilamarchaeum sp.]|nr:hypothetical protein [Candidatus Bilamarchaeum sp.]